MKKTKPCLEASEEEIGKGARYEAWHPGLIPRIHVIKGKQIADSYKLPSDFYTHVMAYIYMVICSLTRTFRHREKYNF